MEPEALLNQGEGSAPSKNGGSRSINHICPGRLCLPMPSQLLYHVVLLLEGGR